MQLLPGTNLPAEDIKIGFEKIMPSIEATGGLTLAQVCSVTGLEQSTIQNWIKRGWVAHPENKRYGEYQLARIMIINMLRSSMQLENIAKLLRYVNGEADDRGDDIIPDSILYTILCMIISRCRKKEITSGKKVREEAENCTSDYSEVWPGAKEKLVNALTVMTLGYIASETIRETNTLYERLFTPPEKELANANLYVRT